MFMLSFVYTCQSHKKKADSSVGAQNLTVSTCQTPSYFKTNCFYDQLITSFSVLVSLINFVNAFVFLFSHFSYIEKSHFEVSSFLLFAGVSFPARVLVRTRISSWHMTRAVHHLALEPLSVPF